MKANRGRKDRTSHILNNGRSVDVKGQLHAPMALFSVKYIFVCSFDECIKFCLVPGLISHLHTFVYYGQAEWL
jgi:hypothetical protein